MTKDIASVTTKIYEQLKGLAPEERRRAVDAALLLAGEPIIAPADGSSVARDAGRTDEQSSLHPAANPWLKRNGIPRDKLDEIFHFDKGKVALILGEPIGKSKREQTINTYLLIGLAAFFENGEANFTDENARKYCQQSGCYDKANHAQYVKGFKNKITGNKSSGWTLTARI